MTRRQIVAGLMVVASRQALTAEEQEREVQGFPVFDGPDILKDLTVGTTLQVRIRGTKYKFGLVFALGRQIGYIDEGGTGALPLRAAISRVEEGPDGCHRIWMR
jgi:hypothetical protein